MNDSGLNRALLVCGVVVPTAAIVGSNLLGSGVSTSYADVPEQQEQVFSFPYIELQGAVSPKSDYQAVRSPFWIDPALQARTTPRRLDDDHDRLEPDPTQPLPDVQVTSILPNPKNPLAIIDGKPCKIGDTLPNGWTVLSINSDDFSVTLLHESGQQVRERLKNKP